MFNSFKFAFHSFQVCTFSDMTSLSQVWDRWNVLNFFFFRSEWSDGVHITPQEFPPFGWKEFRDQTDNVAILTKMQTLHGWAWKFITMDASSTHWYYILILLCCSFRFILYMVQSLKKKALCIASVSKETSGRGIQLFLLLFETKCLLDLVYFAKLVATLLC